MTTAIAMGSPALFDACTPKPSQPTWAPSPPICCYRTHPPSPFVIITRPRKLILRVEGRVDPQLCVHGCSEPDRPRIENVQTGFDFVNVSWRSSDEEPSTNPASEFVVEYQLQSGTVHPFLCYDLTWSRSTKRSRIISDAVFSRPKCTSMLSVGRY